MRCFVNNSTLHGDTFIFISFHTSFPVSFYYVICMKYVKYVINVNDRDYLLVHDFIIKFVLVFNCCKNFPGNKIFFEIG